jgi:hypothetical protein
LGIVVSNSNFMKLPEVCISDQLRLETDISEHVLWKRVHHSMASVKATHVTGNSKNQPDQYAVTYSPSSGKHLLNRCKRPTPAIVPRIDGGQVYMIAVYVNLISK